MSARQVPTVLVETGVGIVVPISAYISACQRHFFLVHRCSVIETHSEAMTALGFSATGCEPASERNLQVYWGHKLYCHIEVARLMVILAESDLSHPRKVGVPK